MSTFPADEDVDGDDGAIELELDVLRGDIDLRRDGVLEHLVRIQVVVGSRGGGRGRGKMIEEVGVRGYGHGQEGRAQG